ncbi:hypothetical protein [Aidingimonas lacisalsi]|uniref:hypothetical protein n=1 Tax=Aidingimonas lacisalsi TaxID=2604086 RepID=UPI0011D1C6B1|nr:hypothetical protein [Aidingimonas lacisalsi]
MNGFTHSTSVLPLRPIATRCQYIATALILAWGPAVSWAGELQGDNDTIAVAYTTVSHQSSSYSNNNHHGLADHVAFESGNDFGGNGGESLPGTFRSLEMNTTIDSDTLSQVRGRYTPSSELEKGTADGVILWDEGHVGKGGGSSKGSNHSMGQGNIQNNSITTQSKR